MIFGGYFWEYFSSIFGAVFELDFSPLFGLHEFCNLLVLQCFLDFEVPFRAFFRRVFDRTFHRVFTLARVAVLGSV